MGNWGGPREGAGRKPKEPGQKRVTLSTRISGRSSDHLRAYAERTGKTLSEVLDEMVAYVAGQPAFDELLAELREHDVPASTLEKAETAYETLAQTVERSQGQLEAAAQQLADQEQLLQGLVDTLPGALAYLDGLLVLRLVNASWVDYLGGTAPSFVGRHLFDVFPGLSGQADAPLRQLIAAGRPWHMYGLPFSLGEGDSARATYWDLSLSPVREPDGAVRGWLAYAVEVSDRVQREGELARLAAANETQRLLLESIVETCPAGLMYVDPQFFVRAVNPAYLRLRKRSAADFLNRQLFEEVMPAAQEALEPLMRRVLESGTPHHDPHMPFPVPQVGEAPTTRHTFSILPVFGQGRQVSGLLILVQDCG